MKAPAMRTRNTSLGRACAAALLAVCVAVSASPQEPDGSRSSADLAGHPDFSGTWERYTPPRDPNAPPPQTPPPGQAEQRSKDEARDVPKIAEPVNPFTGEFEIDQVDFELPSVGFPFVFRRVYKSGRTFFGPWGYNWDHNYNQYLRALSGGSIAFNTSKWGVSFTGTYIGKAYEDDRFLDQFGLDHHAIKVDPEFYLDTQLSFTPIRNYEFYFGVDNLLDNDAPNLLSGTTFNNTGADTAAGVYDIFGRRYYAGARLRF